MINIVKIELEDVLLLRPSFHSDSRGYFFESYNKNLLSNYNLNINWELEKHQIVLSDKDNRLPYL